VAAFIPPGTGTILDIGCAQGAFLKSVKDLTGAETWGVESVEEAARVAGGQVDHLLLGKIEEVLDLLPGNYFDCITFNDVLEHLMEPAQVLQMVKPKLSARGVIIASIPSFRFIRNLVEIVVRKEWEYKELGILDSTHLRFFTKKSMKRMFEEAGYEVVRQEGISPIGTWKFRLLNTATLGILNDTKYAQFVCIARVAGSAG